jgi:hypothetical protein
VPVGNQIRIGSQKLFGEAEPLQNGIGDALAAPAGKWKLKRRRSIQRSIDNRNVQGFVSNLTAHLGDEASANLGFTSLLLAFSGRELKAPNTVRPNSTVSNRCHAHSRSTKLIEPRTRLTHESWNPPA